jgi:hypothetical protein
MVQKYRIVRERKITDIENGFWGCLARISRKDKILDNVNREKYVLTGYENKTVWCLQGVLGGKVNILGGHNISHSKLKDVYIHMSYSEWFPRQR